MPELQATPRLRLFIAIILPDAIKERLLQAQADLRRASSGALGKWCGPEQFHLTLRFLGSVDSAGVPSLAAALAQVCAGLPELHLRAAGIGFFPGPRSPRVVWAGVSEAEGRLAPAHEAVQQASAAFTAEELETRFSGHVTLGRIKSIRRQETDALAAAAGRFAATVFGDWTAPEIHLVRSELSPRGARYSTVQAFPLLAKATPI